MIAIGTLAILLLLASILFKNLLTVKKSEAWPCLLGVAVPGPDILLARRCDSGRRLGREPDGYLSGLKGSFEGFL